MIRPTHIRATEMRRQDLLAAAARSRLVTRSSESTPAPKAGRVKLVVGYVRYAASSLAAVAFIGSTN